MNDRQDTIEDLFNRLGEQEKQNVINYAYLYDDIRGLISEIRKLQSNWNSLREWIMQLKNSYMETDNIFDDAKFRILLSILDKMNELEKSGNK